MCGRYAAKNDVREIVEEFDLDVDAEPSGTHPIVPIEADRLPADYNVAPTKPVYIVAQRDQRKLLTANWGLVPSWAKDPSVGARMINARMETVVEKPAFKKAFAQRRCLLPAAGYYEWYTPDAPKARKQPFYLHPQNASLMALAGIYEIWRDRSIEDADAPGAWLWSCSVITSSATDEFGKIHDRMPMTVDRSDYAAWLSESDPQAALGLLAPQTGLTAYPVSTLVNRVANNGPELIEPIALETGIDEAEPTLPGLEG